MLIKLKAKIQHRELETFIHFAAASEPDTGREREVETVTVALW